MRVVPLLEFLGASVARSCGRVLWEGSICCGVHRVVSVHCRMTAFGMRCLAFSGRPITVYGERREYLTFEGG
jgi:hypothetical protein